MTNEAYKTKFYHSEKPDKAEQLCLSILVSNSSFMYAISANQFKTVYEICHMQILHHLNAAFDLTDRISYLINNNQLHQKKFEKVNIAFLNSDFTLIPEAFFAPGDANALLGFSSGAADVKGTMRHRVKDLEFCFMPGQELLSFFERTFPNASIRHSGAVNIDLFFSQHSLLNQDLFLNIGDHAIELAAKQKNKLLFYNVFNFESNEDILYYLLFAMEQFELDPLQVKLSVSCQKEISDDLIKTFKRYIKHVHFSVADPSVKLKGELSSLPGHYYFTLLNQHLCEL